ncbi:MAG: DUF2066 domain-containing protein [Xanthomonadales bacterium]|nr:DUF2066 domain-containing protein [Xanthomonadales bacterium]
MRLIVPLLFAALLYPVMVAGATPDLYVGEVPVPDQSQSAREAAFPAALEQVLGKLSGLRTLDAYPAVTGVVQTARSLVLSFYYEQRDQHQLDGVTGYADASTPEPVNVLVVRFSPPGVDELMQVAGLPRWPPDRAVLEVWVLIDDGFSRRVLPLEYEYLRPPVDQVARNRGLPLEWPSGGPEGEYGVDVQLLWGGYTESLVPEGQPGHVLVVAARREGPEWSTRQILEFDDAHWSWRNRNIDLVEALTEAMHQAVDQIAAVHAIAPSDQGRWVHEIVVSGMSSGEDYERCLAYLESLAVVDGVVVQSADSSGVRMSLSLNAAPQYFEQAVGEGRVLEYAELSGQYVLEP